MHLHHRMLSLGHSHARAVLILYFWTATVGFGVALFALVKPTTALLLAALAMVTALLLTIGPLRWRQIGGTARSAPADPAPAPEVDKIDDSAKTRPRGLSLADIQDENQMNTRVGPP
jgi:UDP-GlcNAc:undecaprenyl-phosphate GlcNAc-1-phosphate transferase